MFETWLKHAHPGLPRRTAWTMAWLVLPLILPVVVLLELLAHGFSQAGDLFATTRSQTLWLWRQRSTFSSDPWKQAR
jgi:hypothetical protein